MAVKIMRAIISFPRNLGIEDGYKESIKDFEVAGSSGEERANRVEISVEDIIDQLDRFID